MTKIRAFSAIRPCTALAAEVAALPYDVYSREEAAAAVQGHPYSFLNIDRPETQFDPGQDMYAPEVYQKADEMLKEWLDKGILIREEAPAYYIYSQTMGGRMQTGLVALSSVDDYLSDVVKKHENTRADKEEDRMRHVDTTSMQTGPIFLAYRDSYEADHVIDQGLRTVPLYDFESDDGIRHTLYRISDERLIGKLTEAFAEIPCTYIADGHHRAASAVRVAKKRREAHPNYTGEEEFNWFLSVLFPMSQLRIYDYNRVVHDLNGLSREEFLKKLAESYDVTELKLQPGEEEKDPEYMRPYEKGQVGMYLSGVWYRLTAREEILSGDPVKGLDVSMLQDHVLAPLLGILDPKTDRRIDFVGGIRGVQELKKRTDACGGVAFLMYPTSMRELFRVADNGLLMPPKSTWFEPKLRSGLFIHEIER